MEFLDAARAFVDIFGSPPFESLVDRLRDENRYRRQLAAARLARLDDPRVVEPLLGASRDDYARVRSWAVLGLKRRRDPRIPAELIRMLHDSDATVRADAALALGLFPDPGAVEPLIAALTDRDRWVRWAAALSLGPQGDRLAVEPLRRLRDAEPASAKGPPPSPSLLARALGIGPEERETLRDTLGNVRWAAEASLMVLEEPMP